MDLIESLNLHGDEAQAWDALIRKKRLHKAGPRW